MLRAFFLSREWALWAWGGLALMLALIGVEVWIQAAYLNKWYREIWDFLQIPDPDVKAALSEAGTVWEGDLRDKAEAKIRGFWGFLLEFCYIVFPLIFIGIFLQFFASHYAFRWRQSITFAYLPYWEKTEHEIEGASQRMQEDPQKFARILESLGLGAFRSLLTIIGFLPILWTVSNDIIEKFTAATALADPDTSFPLPFLRWAANTPGSMAWVAISLAVAATGASFLVGIKLPGLEYNNQKVEARFRKRLVYAEDDKSFADFPSLFELFTGLRFNYFRLFLHYGYFGLWSGLYIQFLVIADFIFIGTGIALGVLTLGFLNQIGHAFNKVSESFSFFVRSWTTVTELLSVIKRLREFERNIGYAGGGAPAQAEAVQAIVKG
jgi:peptide/bleomycin uptake transporter